MVTMVAFAVTTTVTLSTTLATATATLLRRSALGLRLRWRRRSSALMVVHYVWVAFRPGAARTARRSFLPISAHMAIGVPVTRLSARRPIAAWSVIALAVTTRAISTWPKVTGVVSAAIAPARLAPIVLIARRPVIRCKIVVGPAAISVVGVISHRALPVRTTARCEVVMRAATIAVIASVLHRSTLIVRSTRTIALVRMEALHVADVRIGLGPSGIGSPAMLPVAVVAIHPLLPVLVEAMTTEPVAAFEAPLAPVIEVVAAIPVPVVMPPPVEITVRVEVTVREPPVVDPHVAPDEARLLIVVIV